MHTNIPILFHRIDIAYSYGRWKISIDTQNGMKFVEMAFIVLAAKPGSTQLQYANTHLISSWISCTHMAHLRTHTNAHTHAHKCTFVPGIRLPTGDDAIYIAERIIGKLLSTMA